MGEGKGSRLSLRPQTLTWMLTLTQWPGWQCIVERVNVTVYYGFS